MKKGAHSRRVHMPSPLSLPNEVRSFHKQKSLEWQQARRLTWCGGVLAEPHVAVGNAFANTYPNMTKEKKETEASLHGNT